MTSFSRPFKLASTSSLVEAGLAQLALHVLRAVRVVALELGVERDVLEDAPAQGVPTAKERPRFGGVDPFQAAAKPWLERDALVGLEQQRVQEEHAELAVAEPGLALARTLERADVDEHRPRAPPLHVVGSRVLEREARPRGLAA